MAKLPPVRPRGSYADVAADDLAFALFHDRIVGGPGPGDDAQPPPAPDLTTEVITPAAGTDDRLRLAIVAALDEVEALAASAAMLADLPEAERAAVMQIADDLLLGAPDAAADVDVTPEGDAAVVVALPGADWLIPYTDDGTAIQVADPSAWLRQDVAAELGKAGASIKRPDVYRALRRQGYDKAKAAAIANATAAGTVDHTRKCETCGCLHGPDEAHGTTTPPTAPAYAPARDPRVSCGTCQAFRATGGEADGSGAYGQCLWFDIAVDPAYTCDAWAPATGLFNAPAVANATEDVLTLGEGVEKAKERDYTRADDGKFSESAGSGSGKKDGEKGKAKKPADKPKEAPAEADAAAQEAAAVAAGLDPRDAALLADPEALAALPVEEAERLSAAGLLVRNDDGSYSPSELGAKVGEQVKAGDAEAAAESVEQAAEDFQEAQNTGGNNTPADAAPGEAGAPAEAEPAGGKGGGGGGEPFRPPSQDSMMETIGAIPPEQRDANREQINSKLKLPPGLVAAVDEVKDPSEGIKMNPEASAAARDMGLVRMGDNGTEELTDAGRLFVTAAAAGDAKSAQLALQQGKKDAPPSSGGSGGGGGANTAPSHAASKVSKRAAGPAPAALSWSFAFAKVDGEQRIVEGYASSEALDSQPGVWKGQTYEGDVVDAASINAALPEYLQYANIREMHQPSAVGLALKAEVIPGDVEVEIDGRRRVLRNPLYLVVKVVDDAAWQKVKAGVYKGFSIGGAVVDAALQRVGGRIVRLIKALTLTEISLVDRPANPDARIVLWKAAGPTTQGGTMPATPTTLPASVTLAAFKEALAAEGLTLTKAAEASKVVAMIQTLRNDAELKGDVEAAQMLTQAITMVLEATGNAEGGEGAVEVETPEGDVMTETSEIAQGARAGSLQKAGRVMAQARMAKMRPVLKSLLALMADAGDEPARRALKAYDAGDDAPADAAAGAAIGKAVGTELSPYLSTLTTGLAKLQQDQAALAGVVDALSRVARPGGPAARPMAVAKTLTTDRTPPAERPEVSQSELAEIRRLALTEPNPQRRLAYQKQFAALTGEIIG